MCVGRFPGFKLVASSCAVLPPLPPWSQRFPGATFLCLFSSQFRHNLALLCTVPRGLIYDTNTLAFTIYNGFKLARTSVTLSIVVTLPQLVSAVTVQVGLRGADFPIHGTIAGQ